MKTIQNTCTMTLFVSGCFIFTAGISRGEPVAPDATAIAAAAEDFHKALSAGKRDQVMAVLQPDALIVEGGTVQTRDEYQSEHLSADIAYARAVPSTPRYVVVRQEGDVAWVTSNFTIMGRFHDKPVDNLAAETMVLTKTPAGWRIRTVHWSSQRARAGEGG
jgi:ketosteroid isomerase-like protein